jgi:maleylpyruvate isomerase
MADPRAILTERLDHCQQSLDRLVADVRRMSDEEIQEPSRLPDWSRGHVLTHIARNADGMANLAAWAISGNPHPMYPSRESRDADISGGAQRSSATIADDLTSSGRRFAATWEAVAELDSASLSLALDRVMHLGAPSPHSPVVTGATAPLARRREIELHHVDLGMTDYSGADWPGDFAAELLETIAPTRASADGLAGVARLVDDDGASWQLADGPDGLTVQGPTWMLALWLTGRPVDASQLIAIDAHGSARDVPAAPAWV